ncbi:MAG: hypothetical protein NTX64_14985 [Elusimicrobia bacterium]|nr:hypothetical protein [Elusimicrobiota bacterium]
MNDTTATGIDVGVKKLPVKANVFIWNAVTHANGQLGTAPGTASTPGLNDNLWVYGAKLRAEGMGAWINATVALNAGTNRTVTAGITYPTAASANYSGKALLLDLGYKADISNVGGITPWANFGWGSGRHDARSNKNEGFTAIASDYRPGVIYGRFNSGALALGGSGLAGQLPGGGVSTAGLGNRQIGNRQIWGAGLKATPAGLSKLTAGVSYWDFNYQYATLGATGVSAANGNRHIGSEFDLQIDWAHSENVVLDAGWAVFNPGGYVKEQNRTTSPVTGTNSVNMLFADLGIKF